MILICVDLEAWTSFDQGAKMTSGESYRQQNDTSTFTVVTSNKAPNNKLEKLGYGNPDFHIFQFFVEFEHEIRLFE